MADATGGSWDVFLAYAGGDRARARELYAGLVSAGLRVCFDQEVLHPGDDWHRLLPGHLRASSVVVALVSQSTDDAHFQRAELLLAIDMVRREGGRLVPVRLAEDVRLPYGTEMLHALDMHGPGDVADAAGRIAALFPGLRTVPLAAGTQVLSERIPVPPKFFTGRDDLLARVGALVGAARSSVVTQAIDGLGGVGKTSLAAAVVDAHRHEFDIVWWIRAEDSAVAVTDLADLAPHLGVAAADDTADTAARVRAALERTNLPWLLVFDNAVDERSIEELLPQRGSGAVLITSRNTEFPNADAVVPVDVFPPAVAADFLRSRVQVRNPQATAEDLAEVIDRLDGLPLALEQAAAWVSRVPARRFAGFVELYDDHTRDPFPDGTRPRGYEHTATTTWRLSIAAAAEEAPLAERVLSVLAYLAPEALPTAWLLEVGDDDYFDNKGPAAVDDALTALHAYSLAAITPDGTIGVHRLVQAAARRNELPGAYEAAVRVLRQQDPGKAHDHRNWPTLASLTPHGLALADHLTSPEAARDLWRVLDEIATYQRVSGNPTAAIATATTALGIANSYFAPDDPDTLSSRNNLATAYQAAGDLGRAIPRFEATLADRERALGQEHPATLASRNNLAAAYREAGDLGRALPLLEANLADCERVLGPDHPDTTATRENLRAARSAAEA